MTTLDLQSVHWCAMQCPPPSLARSPYHSITIFICRLRSVRGACTRSVTYNVDFTVVKCGVEICAYIARCVERFDKKAAYTWPWVLHGPVHSITIAVELSLSQFWFSFSSLGKGQVHLEISTDVLQVT